MMLVLLLLVGCGGGGVGSSSSGKRERYWRIFCPYFFKEALFLERDGRVSRVVDSSSLIGSEADNFIVSFMLTTTLPNFQREREKKRK